MRGDSGRGDTVLACAGFRDDARFAHSDGKNTLTDSVIDFVRAGMEKIFALEVNARAAESCGEARGELQRRGAASEILEEILEFGLEGGIAFSLFVGALEFLERDHEGFRDVATAVGAETAGDGGGDGE